jgi:hypothetical protein
LQQTGAGFGHGLHTGFGHSTFGQGLHTGFGHGAHVGLGQGAQVGFGQAGAQPLSQTLWLLPHVSQPLLHDPHRSMWQQLSLPHSLLNRQHLWADPLQSPHTLAWPQQSPP